MRKNRTNTFAVWTPDLSDVNGQNLVTRRVVSKQNALISGIFEYPPGGGPSIPVAIWAALRLCTSLLMGRHGGIYLVGSRSKLGFLRDVLPLAMSLFGHRVIVHIHGSDFPDLFTRDFLGRIGCWLYRRCEVVVPSAHLLPLLRGVTFRNVRVCENFADTAAVRYGTVHLPRAFESPRRFVVLWNSNLMASKGIMELVEGLRLLRGEGLIIELNILGSPIADNEATKSEMAEFVASLEKEPWINVKGQVPPEEVPIYLATCDAVALPSTYKCECQPLSVAQAMLAGRLVILAPTAALRATVGTYPGIFANRDPEAIANKLRPHASRSAVEEMHFDREVKIAWERFSPERFDMRMSQILIGGDAIREVNTAPTLAEEPVDGGQSVCR